MNLAEALDVLPEISTPVVSNRLYKVDHRLVGREHVEEGATVVLAHVPGSTSIFRFTPEQWKLVHLFDGERSYEEIAKLLEAETGAQFDVEDIRDYAQELDEIGFWYKTPQEKNIALMQKLRERRKKTKKARTGDLARVLVAHWDADRLITRFHERLGFVFTPWFTALTLALFAFMAYVFIDRWSEIGSDTLKYYTFTDKSFGDLGEFWLLFFVLAFFHESAHALACKHYQGGVHSMGFHLIYLTPAFFVDVTEAWVYANRVQRVITMLAGIWIELAICGLATLVWWGTPAGGGLHELAYKIILITGVAVVLMNLNPLIKLDGYYILSEIVGIDEIKEKSTAFVSGWVQHHVFGLPVHVPHVSRRRLWFFVPYALLSGLYSYLLLYAVARFSGNVFRNYNPEWAFVPTIVVALLIFKSRIRKLGTFMKNVYQDKRHRLGGLLTSRRLMAAGLVVLVVFLLPVWRERVDARFILEPIHKAIIRAEVPGTVAEVLVHEGDAIAADAPIVRLRNLDLESQAGSADAEFRMAAARANEAQMHYGNVGAAEQDRQQLLERKRLLEQQIGRLDVRSTLAGTVMSVRPANLTGSRLVAGTEIAEVADVSTMQARLYVPESDMRDVRVGQTVRLRSDSAFSSMNGTVAGIAPASSQMEGGLAPEPAYKGLAPPQYYVLTVAVPNEGDDLRYGMTGNAKIEVRRSSVAGLAWKRGRDFVARKLW